jgi:hypothetical protein
MSGPTFAALRRRVLREPLLRARLRTAFARTLAEEGADEPLTPDQADDLRLAVLLYDAYHRPDRSSSEQPAGPARIVDIRPFLPVTAPAVRCPRRLRRIGAGR